MNTIIFCVGPGRYWCDICNSRRHHQRANKRRQKQPSTYRQTHKTSYVIKPNPVDSSIAGLKPFLLSIKAGLELFKQQG